LARLETTFTDGFNRLFSLLETNIETTNKLIDKLTPKDLEESSQMYG
jgi:hypothetical protein